MDLEAGRLAAEQPLQVEEHLARVGIPPLGPLGERLRHDLADAVADRRVQVPERRRRLVLVHGDDAEARLPHERRPPRQQVEEGHAHRVHVGGRTDRAPPRTLFRRHVQRRPDDRPGLGHVQGFRFHDVASQPEIRELHPQPSGRAGPASSPDPSVVDRLGRGIGREEHHGRLQAGGRAGLGAGRVLAPLPVGERRRRRGGRGGRGEPRPDHQDVLGLDVAMHDPAPVREVEGASDVGHDLQGRRLIEPPPPPQPSRQARPGDELQHEVMDAPVFIDLDEVGHVRVIDLGEEAGLLGEPPARPGSTGLVGVEHLDGDRRAVGRVPGPVDGPHAPLSQFLEDQEPAEPGPRPDHGHRRFDSLTPRNPSSRVSADPSGDAVTSMLIRRAPDRGEPIGDLARRGAIARVGREHRVDQRVQVGIATGRRSRRPSGESGRPVNHPASRLPSA